MKMISNLAALLLAGISHAAAQENHDIGFIRIVNAISPGTGNAKFIIDGKDLFADGYQLGQTTGGYGVKAGSKNVEVRKDGVGKGVTKQQIAAGETVTVIAFAERLPQEQPDDPPKWAIKLLKLKQQDVASGFGLSIVSVCKADELPLNVTVLASGKESKAHAKRLSITSVDIGKMRSEVMIRNGGAQLTTVSPDSRGNYVVIVYEDAGGRIQALYFFDPKFVVAG